MFVTPAINPSLGPLSILASVIAIVSLSFLFNRYLHGLHHIPGPILASLTDIWRTVVVWKRRPERMQIQLHERYGPVVRLGPKPVSVANPHAIKIIYALKADFVKSDFYPVQ